MSNINSAYLKEMGITEWVSRDCSVVEAPLEQAQSIPITSQAHWWFFGSKPQGDAELLFQNILRVLSLAPGNWSWMNPSDDLSKLTPPENGSPLVALAFGSQAVHKITGERDPLPQLRETVLALNNDADIPVIATLDLNQLIAQPKDKALLWQDLLLAKSVLQNI